jgi:hypothetical protein
MNEKIDIDDLIITISIAFIVFWGFWKLNILEAYACFNIILFSILGAMATKLKFRKKNESRTGRA